MSSAAQQPETFILSPAPNRQFLRVGAPEIHLIDLGPRDGPVIVLLHGLLLSSATFRPLLRPLTDAGYRVVAFDRPPFGLSAKSPTLSYGVRAEADLTVAVLDALNIQQAALLGHSAGGRTAAQVAWQHPQRVSHLILVSPSLGRSSGGQFGPAINSIITLVVQGLNPFPGLARAALRRHFTDEQLRTFALANFPRNPDDPHLLQDAVQVTRTPGWEAGFHAYGRSMTRQRGAVSWRELPTLDVPTLLLWGEQDTLIPAQNARAVQAAIPGSTLKTYPAEGHIPWFSDPPGFVADLRGFLKGLSE